MRTTRRLLMSLLLLMLAALPMAAQVEETPDVITEAVDALSVRLDTSLTLADLDRYYFEDRTFDSAALGCPQPGQVYAEVLTDGYQFLLTYNNTTYEYHVSDAGDVAFCESYVAATATPASAIPNAVQLAVNDLNTRLDTDVSFQTLAGFDFEDRTFDSAALGCPQPGETYAQVLTDGYQVLLTYAGFTYDYRVSDGGVVALCDSYPANTTNPTPAPITTATPVETVPPVEGNCPTTPVLPLQTGDQARTTPGLPSNIRASASTDAEIFGEIPAGATFNVTGQSVCSENFHWWSIEYEGISGWVAQGAAGLLYVVPIPSANPLAFDLAPITPDDSNEIVELAQAFGNVQGGVAWSPDSQVLAVASSNPDDPGVWLYDVSSLATPPRLVNTPNLIQSVAFGPEGLLVTGDNTGLVSFWNAVTGENLASFQAYTEPVISMRFNAEGTILTTVSDSRRMSFWGVPR